jgi:Gas vesicle protein K
VKSQSKRTKKRKPRAVAAVPVTAADLRALKAELERRLNTPTAVRVGKLGHAAVKKGTTGLRWNPEPEDVQKSVAQLVLTIVEFLRRLMERQAIRRMEQKTLTRKEVEAVGVALMTLEDTVREIGRKFGLTPEDLNLDLGPLGKLM